MLVAGGSQRVGGLMALLAQAPISALQGIADDGNLGDRHFPWKIVETFENSYLFLQQTPEIRPPYAPVECRPIAAIFVRQVHQR